MKLEIPQKTLLEENLKLFGIAISGATQSKLFVKISEGECTQPELMKHVSKSRAVVSRHLKAMTKAGLVSSTKKQAAKTGRPTDYYVLTDMGGRLLDICKPVNLKGPLKLNEPDTGELDKTIQKINESKSEIVIRNAWADLAFTCQRERVVIYPEVVSLLKGVLGEDDNSERKKDQEMVLTCLRYQTKAARESGEQEVLKTIEDSFLNELRDLLKREDTGSDAATILYHILPSEKSLKLFMESLMDVAEEIGETGEATKLEALYQLFQPYFELLCKELDRWRETRDWLYELMEKGVSGLSKKSNDRIKEWAENFYYRIRPLRFYTTEARTS